jgi:ABC-2 type transport system permease protein
MNVTRRLLSSELRLLLREPLVLAFVIAFPVITVLVLGGVFDDDDEAFEGALPSDYYIAAYFGVVIAAVGLIMLPVHIASYRETGVLRRFDAAGFPRWSFPASQLIMGAVFIAIGAVFLLATAAVAYGLPGIEDTGRTMVGIVAGSLAFISIGVLLGTLLPNARSAQGAGMLLFLPMFLLAGGGPPPGVMSPVMNDVATGLPLTHVVRAIQEPWLGIGTGTDHLASVVVMFVGATLLTLARTGSFAAVAPTTHDASGEIGERQSAAAHQRRRRTSPSLAGSSVWHQGSTVEVSDVRAGDRRSRQGSRRTAASDGEVDERAATRGDGVPRIDRRGDR